jgi:FkbM family methyltransferase
MPNIIEARHGKFLILPNDALGQALMNNGDFEPHFYNVAKNVIKPGDICLDCGANLGYHAVTMAKMVGPAGKVLAFEPLRVIYQQLCGNVFINDLRNVFCFNVALGNENKMIQMDYVDVDRPQGINIGATKIGGGGDVVQMIKIDEVISSGVSFLKIDVQGSEIFLLEGAEKLIQNSRPIMFIEVENQWLNCFGQSSETLLNKILSLDYILVRINNEYPCDHVAIPREKKDLLDIIMKDVGYPIQIVDGKSVKLNFDRTDWQKEINYGGFEVY